MARRTPQPTYYDLLQVPSRATDAEIRAAYARLQEAYSVERLGAAAPEFQEQAAQKRQQLADAYAALADPDQRAAYDRQHNIAATEQPEFRTNTLDFRPLPPARGQERTTMAQAIEPPSLQRRAVQPGGLRTWLAPLAVMCGLLAVLLLLVLNNIRTTSGAAAIPTPVLPGLALPYSDLQLSQFRAAAEDINQFETWVAYGNAQFDNLQTLRENAPVAPQYRNALDEWLVVVQAYDRALALRNDPAVRSSRAVALINYGVDAPDPQRVAEAVAEVDRGLAQGETAPRALLNYGLILALTNPPREAEAFAQWRKLIQMAPNAPEAENARTLLQRYGQSVDDR